MAPRTLRRGLPAALLLLAALLASAADASAQLPSAVRDNRRALSFGVLTGGGGVVGFTMMAGARSAFTLDFMADGAFQSSEATAGGVSTGETDAVSLEAFLAPGFRRYMAGRGEVASYIAARALIGFETQINESTSATGEVFRTESFSPSGGAALGFGLEWFVTDAMSLRGEVALDGTYSYRRQETSGGNETVSQRIDFGLSQSAVVFSIWF